MTTKPNIVFVTTHDTGRHFGCYGVETVHTPNIERLAAEGALAESFYCTNPVCSPSRAAMLTGLLPSHNGVMGLVHPPSSWLFNDDVQHLSQILQGREYHTALFYHQHEVMPDNVDRLGFDEWFARQEGEHRPADTVAAAFAEFVAGRATDSKPFYAQIGFGETHRKWDVGGVGPDDSKGVTVPAQLVDNDAAREDAAQLQGAVRMVDDAVGIILDALDATGLANNTIVVFTVDHGLEFPRSKWHLYDPGIEVAFLIRWPAGDITGGRRVAPLLSNVDVMPTLLDLIDEQPPYSLDGLSFAALLRDPASPPTRDAIFAMMVGGGDIPEARCIRTDRWKFIRNFSNHRLLITPVDIAAPAIDIDNCPITQLYDLQADPREFVNLSGDPACADIERHLDSRLWQWLQDAGDPILDGPIRVPIYQASVAAYEAWQQCPSG